MTQRDEKNWISFTCALAFILAYFFLPFYSFISGWLLIQFNAAMVLPGIVGIIMAFAPLFFHPKVSIGIGSFSLLMTVVLMLLGNTILQVRSSLGISMGDLGGLASGGFGLMAPAGAPGIGSILCVLLCIGSIIAELVLNNRKTKTITPDEFF